MTRPRYETPQDLVNERKAVDVLLRRMFAVTAEKIEEPKQYPIDFRLWSGPLLVGYAEVKRRPKPWSYFVGLENNGHGGPMVAEHKITTARADAEPASVPYYLLFSAGDGVYAMRVEPEEWRHREWQVEMKGRTDRNDPADIEPCVVLSCAQFVRIGEVVE